MCSSPVRSYQWCNGKCTRVECSRSCVRARFGHISGVMVNVLVSSAVDRVFEPGSVISVV